MFDGSDDADRLQVELAEYHANGERGRSRTGEGGQVYIFDFSSLPRSRTPSDGTAICSFAFTRDANGNILTSHREDGSFPVTGDALRITFPLTSPAARSSMEAVTPRAALTHSAVCAVASAKDGKK
jgi:hypothetical protein